VRSPAAAFVTVMTRGFGSLASELALKVWISYAA
jgi:hypothetical protein